MTAVVTRPSGLSAPPRSRLRAVGRELAIVLALIGMYFGVRGVTESGVDEAVANAQRVMELERELGIWWEPELQARIIGSDAAVAVLNWIYIYGHWPVIALVAAWLVTRHPAEFPVYRNAFAISGAIGMVIFMSFPVAPPRLVDGLGLVDTITAYSEGYRVLQPPAFVNQYAAVPSLHFGWDLLLGLALIRLAGWWVFKLFGALMPAAMLAAIVLTANHYLIDAVIGGAITLFGLLVAERIARRGRQRARAPDVPSQRRPTATRGAVPRPVARAPH